MSELLFRVLNDNYEEAHIAEKIWEEHYVNHRSDIRNNSLVIGRYSVLPHYEELEYDLKTFNSTLINSSKQHRWIANFAYYQEFQLITPQSWQSLVNCPWDGPFVVKGNTNSKKWSWNTKMFAPDKKTALNIGADLAADDFIGPQGIIYRQYIPLKIFEIGLNGLPFSNEWRFFFLRNTLIDYGYYWSCAEKLRNNDELPNIAIEFAYEIARIASLHCNFFVIDIAEKEDGGWILIELNDGQMSGLSTIEPNNFYRKLLDVIVDFEA